MAIEQVYGLPGVRAARTASHRTVLRQGDYTFLAQGGIINGATARDTGNTGDLDVLRAGLLMGVRTSDSQWSPSILGVTTNAEAIGSTSIEAAAAVVTELARLAASGTFTLVGPAIAGGPVMSETVTYSAASGTTITVTAITGAFIAGSFICPNDGSQVPKSFIPDGWGIKVTDQDAASADVEFPQIPVGGVIDSSQLINWPSDAGLRNWIVTRLNDAAGGKFVFDHYFQ